MKRVRIEQGGRAIDATLDGDTVTADGTEIKINQVKRWLPPVTPSKILATHLTYRSRAEEYKMARMPSEPSYFMKPPVAGSSTPRVRSRS
jgi:5-oxopent-3-ene-1,2,5-tricarboxylate decarboxylase/2-hydroxyhepta-2,4-diene-1,7-dioate isomerase